jgi:hypothetical protein
LNVPFGVNFLSSYELDVKSTACCSSNVMPMLQYEAARASNLSAGARNYPQPPPAAMTKPDMPASAPGVMSMLKGSTELGLEDLMLPGSRFSAQKRNSNRRSGTASRKSTGSSQSQPSRPNSGHHSHHIWPSMSSGRRRMSITSNFSNLNGPQHYLDTMQPPTSRKHAVQGHALSQYAGV